MGFEYIPLGDSNVAREVAPVSDDERDVTSPSSRSTTPTLAVSQKTNLTIDEEQSLVRHVTFFCMTVGVTNVHRTMLATITFTQSRKLQPLL